MGLRVPSPPRQSALGSKYNEMPFVLPSPHSSGGKESSCNAGDLGSNPGLGRSPGEGNSYPLQYSGLEDPMDYSP